MADRIAVAAVKHYQTTWIEPKNKVQLRWYNYVRAWFYAKTAWNFWLKKLTPQHVRKIPVAAFYYMNAKQLSCVVDHAGKKQRRLIADKTWSQLQTSNKVRHLGFGALSTKYDENKDVLKHVSHVQLLALLDYLLETGGDATPLVDSVQKIGFDPLLKKLNGRTGVKDEAKQRILNFLCQHFTVDIKKHTDIKIWEALVAANKGDAIRTHFKGLSPEDRAAFKERAKECPHLLGMIQAEEGVNDINAFLKDPTIATAVKQQVLQEKPELLKDVQVGDQLTAGNIALWDLLLQHGNQATHDELLTKIENKPVPASIPDSAPFVKAWVGLIKEKKIVEAILVFPSNHLGDPSSKMAVKLIIEQAAQLTDAAKLRKIDLYLNRNLHRLSEGELATEDEKALFHIYGDTCPTGSWDRYLHFLTLFGDDRSRRIALTYVPDKKTFDTLAPADVSQLVNDQGSPAFYEGMWAKVDDAGKRALASRCPLLKVLAGPVDVSFKKTLADYFCANTLPIPEDCKGYVSIFRTPPPQQLPKAELSNLHRFEAALQSNDPDQKLEAEQKLSAVQSKKELLDKAMQSMQYTVAKALIEAEPSLYTSDHYSLSFSRQFYVNLPEAKLNELAKSDKKPPKDLEVCLWVADTLGKLPADKKVNFPNPMEFGHQAYFTLLEGLVRLNQVDRQTVLTALQTAKKVHIRSPESEVDSKDLSAKAAAYYFVLNPKTPPQVFRGRTVWNEGKDLMTALLIHLKDEPEMVRRQLLTQAQHEEEITYLLQDVPGFTHDTTDCSNYSLVYVQYLWSHGHRQDEAVVSTLISKIATLSNQRALAPELLQIANDRGWGDKIKPQAFHFLPYFNKATHANLFASLKEGLSSHISSLKKGDLSPLYQALCSFQDTELGEQFLKKCTELVEHIGKLKSELKIDLTTGEQIVVYRYKPKFFFDCLQGYRWSESDIRFWNDILAINDGDLNCATARSVNARAKTWDKLPTYVRSLYERDGGKDLYRYAVEDCPTVVRNTADLLEFCSLNEKLREKINQEDSLKELLPRLPAWTECQRLLGAHADEFKATLKQIIGRFEPYNFARHFPAIGALDDQELKGLFLKQVAEKTRDFQSIDSSIIAKGEDQAYILAAKPTLICTSAHLSLVKQHQFHQLAGVIQAVHHYVFADIYSDHPDLFKQRYADQKKLKDLFKMAPILFQPEKITKLLETFKNDPEYAPVLVVAAMEHNSSKTPPSIRKEVYSCFLAATESQIKLLDPSRQESVRRHLTG